MLDRVNVLGIGVNALNIPLTVAAMGRAIEQRAKGYICITNVHSVSEAQALPSLRAVFNDAFLVTPDGMPLVWLGRLAGHPEMDRVYGPDLLHQVCRVSAQTGWSHFFYGGAPGVAELLASCLQSRYPHLRIVGTYAPPYRPLNPQEKEDLQGQVTRAAPDIIWVGLGMPKQEAFMAEALPWLDTTLMVGVGAAFDFLTGRVRQAPRWVQRSGLEWLFRFFQEPRRLFVRYFKNNPLFIGRILLQKTGLRRYPLDGPA